MQLKATPAQANDFENEYKNTETLTHTYHAANVIAARG